MKKANYVTYTLLVVGGLLVLAGIRMEAYRSVLEKATMICLECIGIG